MSCGRFLTGRQGRKFSGFEMRGCFLIFEGTGPAVLFFPAQEPFRPEPVFPGRPGRFGGFPVFRKPGRRGDQGFRPEQGPFPVGFLGPFLISVYHDFIISGNPGRKDQPEAAFFHFRKTLKISKTNPQAYFRVDFVDILPAGPAGPGKTHLSLFPDRITQTRYIHWSFTPLPA
jgi:hypothetical protein